MIKLVEIGNLFCPVIECDACGELITNIGMGAVRWDWRGDYTDPGPVEFLHKRTCLPPIAGRDHRPWRELREFLDQLRNNVESDPRTQESSLTR